MAFVRWNDQFTSYHIGDNLSNRKPPHETFDLIDVFDKKGAAGSKDSFEAVEKALDNYNVVSLPARLVKRPNERSEIGPMTAEYESRNIILQTLDEGRLFVPGCFICGGEEGEYLGIRAILQSPPDYAAIMDMFGNRGISKYTERESFDLMQRSRGKFLQRLRAANPNLPATWGAINPSSILKIAACSGHFSVLKNLFHFAFQEPEYLTKETMELFVAFDGQRDPITAEWAHRQAEQQVQIGFRFF